jgi:hypothetical protein
LPIEIRVCVTVDHRRAADEGFRPARDHKLRAVWQRQFLYEIRAGRQSVGT